MSLLMCRGAITSMPNISNSVDMVRIWGYLALLDDQRREIFNLWRIKFGKVGWMERESSLKQVRNPECSVEYSLLCYVRFILPAYILKSLTSMVLQFYWSGSERNRKLSWKSWHDLCKLKYLGMGLRGFEGFNYISHKTMLAFYTISIIFCN